MSKHPDCSLGKILKQRNELSHTDNNNVYYLKLLHFGGDGLYSNRLLIHRGSNRWVLASF